MYLSRVIPACTFALFFAATAVVAQDNGSEPIAREANQCGYDDCALRLEAGKLVRGRIGAPVARLGVFSNIPKQVEWTSDSAVVHARRYQARQSAGTALYAGSFIGLTASQFLFAKAASDAQREERELTMDDLTVPLAAGAGSVLVSIVGSVLVRGAQKEIARAIWWHNRAFARP